MIEYGRIEISFSHCDMAIYKDTILLINNCINEPLNIFFENEHNANLSFYPGIFHEESCDGAVVEPTVEIFIGKTLIVLDKSSMFIQIKEPEFIFIYDDKNIKVHHSNLLKKYLLQRPNNSLLNELKIVVQGYFEYEILSY